MDNRNNGNNTAVYIQQQQTCNMEMLETALQVSNCLVSWAHNAEVHNTREKRVTITNGHTFHSVKMMSFCLNKYKHVNKLCAHQHEKKKRQNEHYDWLVILYTWY